MLRKTNTTAPDAVFKALGSPARLTLVRALTGRERCVCDLVHAVGLGWSTTSRHLEILRETGIVRAEKRGQKVFYSLRLKCVSEFIACLDNAKTGCEAELGRCDRGSA